MTMTQQRDGSLYPETAKDALAKWDDGEPLFTIEMGGLGPGYEQAIQVLIFELIRDNTPETIPQFADANNPTKEENERWYRWGDTTVHKHDESAGGYSGAQVGAAKQIAYRALRDGWRATLLSVPNDRLIQVSKTWPRAAQEQTA